MNTHENTSILSHGAVRDVAARLGLTLLLMIGPFGACMAGIVPQALPRPAIVVLCVGLLLVQLAWFGHPVRRRGSATPR